MRKQAKLSVSEIFQGGNDSNKCFFYFDIQFNIKNPTFIE